MFLSLKSFIVAAFIATQVQSSPVDVQALLDDTEKAENYDVIIDQRQNGTNNIRVKYAVQSRMY